jgi:hypothetical protein
MKIEVQLNGTAMDRWSLAMMIIGAGTTGFVVCWLVISILKWLSNHVQIV